MKVIALVSESQGEIIAYVYSADREFSLYFMIAVCLLAIILTVPFTSLAGAFFISGKALKK